MILEQGENHLEARDTYQWQMQSEQIAHVLERNSMPPTTMTGRADARAFSFNIPRPISDSAARLRTIAKDVIAALGVNDISVRQVAGSLHVRVPRSPEAAVPLLDLMAYTGQVRKGTAVLGLGEDSSPILHDFSSPDTPHLLITGDSGAGKTTMLRTIAVSLALNNRQCDLQLAIICPNAIDPDQQRVQMATWAPLNYVPHMLCDVTNRHTEIEDLLMFLSREITYRESNAFRVPRIVVLIDQVDTVVSRGGRQCAEALLMLAQKGEDAGIHLVLSSQTVDPALLSTQLLADLPVRLVGRSASNRMNRILPNEESSAQDLLGEGDFLAVRGKVARRLQGAHINDYDLHLRLSRASHPRGILLADPLDTRVRLPYSAAQSNGVAQMNTRSGGIITAN